MKSPVTDRTLGIPPRSYGPEEKFREVRHRAKDDEVERHKKAKRNRREKQKPEHKIDDMLVLVTGYSHRDYFLVQVLDYDCINDCYYGVLRNSTDPRYLEQMIGHIVKFEGYGPWFVVENIPPESVFGLKKGEKK